MNKYTSELLPVVCESRSGIKIIFFISGNGGEIQWCFSQVKGTIEEDITEGMR